MKKLKSLYLSIPFEFRMSTVYLIIGGLWILFSDIIVAQLTNNQNALTQLQHYKGWFYVASTAFFLFIFTKKHLRKLREAEAMAKENEKLKTAFLENVSHELRTPMNAIIGFTELAQASPDIQKETSQYLQIILNSSKQLLAIVNDVMDTSLLESGNSYIKVESIELNPLLNNLKGYFEPLMRDQVSLKLLPEVADFSIQSDREKLVRIFHNLINNSIKFTHKGSIEVGYTLKQKSVLFFVKDTGIGIKPSLHKSIFTRFNQVEIELAKRTGGTGLGLSICKDMVQLMGGKIWVESKPGLGSKFFFSIPVETKA